MKKKVYINPICESLVVTAAFALCDPSGAAAGDPNPPEAPQRRVF